MKKYLSIFAAVLAVGCTNFKVEESLPVETVDVPVITIQEVGETSITATIAGAEGTGFYSYAVMAGPAKQLDSASLYKLSYKSSSVAYGTFDYAVKKYGVVVAGDADKPLSRDADYTIYAVSASKQGSIGSVVSKTVHTSDAQAPKPSGAAANGNVMTISFSEPVSYDSSKPVTAAFYAVNYVEINADKDGFDDDGKIDDAKAEVKLAADGKSIEVTVTQNDGSPLPAGAWYAVSYPKGAFKDNVGNEMGALVSGPAISSKGELTWKNAAAQIDNKEWEPIDDAKDATFVTPSQTMFSYSIPEGVVVFDTPKTGEVSMLVEMTSETRKTEDYYKLAGGTNWGFLSSTKFIAMYPADLYIEGGYYITVTIGKGAIVDIYGNENAEISHKYLYSFGYTIDGIAGTYVNSGASGYGPNYDEDPWTFTIAKSDDESKGNVMVTEWYGKEAKVYADFNVHTGVFTMPTYYEELSSQQFEDDGTNYVVFWYNFAYFSCSQKQKNDLELYMTELGKFTDGNDYPGYYYEIYLWPESGDPDDIDEDADFVDYDYNIFMPEFSKLEDDAPAAAPAKKAAAKSRPTFQKEVVTR